MLLRGIADACFLVVVPARPRTTFSLPPGYPGIALWLLATAAGYDSDELDGARQNHCCQIVSYRFFWSYLICNWIHIVGRDR